MRYFGGYRVDSGTGFHEGIFRVCFFSRGSDPVNLKPDPEFINAIDIYFFILTNVWTFSAKAPALFRMIFPLLTSTKKVSVKKACTQEKAGVKKLEPNILR